MKPRNYFPLGKAYNEAFCNRVKETQWLANNLMNAKHTLLIAPRRYGKSSLAEKAIAETGLPFIQINFHLCTSEEEVAQLIVNNTIKLIGKSLGGVEKLITSIKKFASNLNPKLSFGDDIATLELIPKEANTNQAVIISESLLLLEKLLREKNKKAVIFFDEFQEIVKISKNTNIEGAIRTAAQEMQNIAIIFSGSIRSLLLHMFEDESRPLYKLCRKLKLNRIEVSHYEKHINKIAFDTWGHELSKLTFDTIMSFSKRHPYYVNYLCDVLWEENETLPGELHVLKSWYHVIQEEWSDALKEISILSMNQRKILRIIATRKIINISSQETCIELGMPASTISSAIEVLIEKDYLENDGHRSYKIINPVLLEVLSRENLIVE